MIILKCSLCVCVCVSDESQERGRREQRDLNILRTFPLKSTLEIQN